MRTDIELDFEVLITHNPKKIVIADTSYWGPIVDKPSIIEILMPGESKVITHYYDKNRVNSLDSYTLGLSCQTCNEIVLNDLPDGIYHFTIKGSPDSFNLTKQFLKTDLTQLIVDEYIMNLTLECNEFSKEVMDQVQKIQLFLESAESNTRLGMYENAQSLLFKVQKMVKKLKGCQPCA